MKTKVLLVGVVCIVEEYSAIRTKVTGETLFGLVVTTFQTLQVLRIVGQEILHTLVYCIIIQSNEREVSEE